MRTAIGTGDHYQDIAALLERYLVKRAEAAERSAFTPNYWPWPELPGMVQVRMAVWDPERGWLTTRRGIVVHGPIPTIESPDIEEHLMYEVKGGLRAMQHAWKKP
jgi:hypothetical protein